MTYAESGVGSGMIGMLAFSKAGHDRRQLYVIIGEDDEYVYLADGRNRTVDRPKKKNKKHIQIIRKKFFERKADSWKDLEIKRVIKMYQEEGNV